jgi:type IV pilus assembly protein PilV
MFVLAVGVLGAASTQATSARLRQQAALESDAVALASSLAARMRVNPAQMALADGSNPYLQLDYDAASGAPSAPPVQCFGAANCDPAQLAQFDIHELERSVYEGFPGGRIAVCRDGGGLLAWTCAASSNAPIVVKIGWRSRTGTGAVPFVATVVSG